jgi:hypothetical protein
MNSDPVTREPIQDVSKLPVNRAIKRQVDAFIQSKLEGISLALKTAVADDSNGSHARRTSDGAGEEDALKRLSHVARLLKLLVGRNDDGCLNGKRSIIASLEACPVHIAQQLTYIEQRKLDETLHNMHEEKLATQILPNLPRVRARDVPVPAGHGSSSVQTQNQKVEAVTAALSRTSVAEGSGRGAESGDAEMCRTCLRPVSVRDGIQAGTCMCVCMCVCVCMCMCNV